ncbi:MAG: type II secretion system GspH family protein [Gammaproteobacteria bacterium]|nr:type II secretion system GspH family protein [Gammaproteobacteria bacterium]MBU1481760.1 type II secretion system GspH family protein [Gammaproteobacteria bacterium]
MPLIRSPLIRSCSGFTYIGLLILVAIMGVTLATIGTFWHTAQQRAREQQLLFIGNQFSSAIYAYYQTPPSEGANAGIKQFPKRLEDLLQDNRHQDTVRYLRKIFADPITGNFEWGLIKGADGGIVGVHSLSETAPLKTENFGRGNESFARKMHYSEWRFTYRPGNNPTLYANIAVNTTPGGSTAGDGSTDNSIPGNTTPVNTTPPEYQVPPPDPLPSDPTADQRKMHLCQIMRVTDANTCAQVAIKFGSAVGAICMASASERYTICTGQQLVALPPLIVQYE